MTVGPGNKELVAKTLAHWKADADLAGIRDEAELAKLSKEERTEFMQLWNDVNRLLPKAAGGASPPARMPDAAERRAKLGAAQPELPRDVFARPR